MSFFVTRRLCVGSRVKGVEKSRFLALKTKPGRRDSSKVLVAIWVSQKKAADRSRASSDCQRMSDEHDELCLALSVDAVFWLSGEVVDR